MGKPLWKRFREEQIKIKIEARKKHFDEIFYEIDMCKSGDIYELDTRWYKIPMEGLHVFVEKNLQELKVSVIEPHFKMVGFYPFTKMRLVFSALYVKFKDGRIVKIVPKSDEYTWG